MPWYRIALLACLGACLGTPAWSSCIDISRAEPIEVSGQLAHRMFSDDELHTGAVARASSESAYILKLDSPTCFTGDESLGDEVTVSEVHLMIDPEENDRLFGDLLELVGKHITVTAKRGFGADTAHHRAPVVLVVATVTAGQPARIDMSENVVEAFYRALAAGDGHEAARHIIPAKRRSGPLSGEAMSRFYGQLEQPLELLDVEALDRDLYRAHYRFRARGGARCNGSAVVSTTLIDGTELISRIIAENGC